MPDAAGQRPPHGDCTGRQMAMRAQMAATQARTTEVRQRTEEVLAEAQAIRQVIADARQERRSSPAGRELLQRSEAARLLARLETMPLIEQAKGIIMAQSHCGEAEAFDMLRRASQRSNQPVRDLAARIVAKAGGTTTPPTAPPPDRQADKSSRARTRLAQKDEDGSARALPPR